MERSNSLIYVDGDILPASEAKISVFDSGFNFADGVFEGIRVYAGRVFRLDRHLRRLYDSARAFSIKIPMDQQAFESEILRWLQAVGVQDDFHFRPIITRGDRFPPRLDPRFCQHASRVVLVGGPVSPARMTGLKVVFSSFRRISPDALDPSVKSLNYGNNVLARLEAMRAGVDDALLLDSFGVVAEASAANVFIVGDGVISTPSTRACFNGITRGAVLELAQAAGYTVRERDITPAQVMNADEVFLTGTGMEIVPIVEVNGQQVSGGSLGPVTKNIVERYGKLVRSEGTPIKIRMAEAV